MKKNILIVVSVAVVVVAIAALIMFLKPSDTANDATSSGGDVATVTSDESPTDAGSEDVGAEESDATGGEESPAVADDGTDYNALVYGENKDDNGEGAPKYANTKSNMSIKPVDPETDPANQLVDSSKVQPLKEEAKPDSN